MLINSVTMGLLELTFLWERSSDPGLRHCRNPPCCHDPSSGTSHCETMQIHTLSDDYRPGISDCTPVFRTTSRSKPRPVRIISLNSDYTPVPRTTFYSTSRRLYTERSVSSNINLETECHTSCSKSSCSFFWRPWPASKEVLNKFSAKIHSHALKQIIDQYLLFALYRSTKFHLFALKTIWHTKITSI